MEPNKKVSVIVFVRDNQEELEAFLAMMKLQTYKNYEIIIVDESEGLITYNDWGQTSKEKAGLKAEGELLVFPNADAYYVPTFLETMTKPHNEGIAEITYCDYLRHHNNYSYNDSKPELGHIGIVNFMINKELFNKTGWPNKGSCGDFYTIKAGIDAGGRIVKVPGVLCVNN